MERPFEEIKKDLEIIKQSIEQASISHSSIECEKTTKGDYKYKFKCYSNDIDGLYNAISQIPEFIKRINQHIMGNGGKIQ